VWRHEVDVLSLLFGLFFLGAAAIWGISADAVPALRGWPLPVLLIVVGLVGLATAVTTRRSRTEPMDPGGPETHRP